MRKMITLRFFRKRKMPHMVLLCALLMLPVFFITGSLKANELLQDKITVKGTVTAAADKSPLPGVSVTIKGTSAGAITDIDGNYTLSASAEDILVFSLLGYITEEVAVGTNTTLDIELDEDIIDIDEVVVIGYGVQKKKLNTGSSLNVKSEEIMSRNTTSAMDALQGVSPGVTITRNNGVPGSGAKVYVRGMGTIGHADPLYVVDGVAVGNINYLSPSDIESIDVLKDGASSAIYGSRAANGVILVTTKKGKSGKINVAYEGYMGWSNPWKLPEPLNALQYAEIEDSLQVNSDQDPYDYTTRVPDWEAIENGEWNGTNWVKEFQNKNAQSQNHSFTFTGGSEYSSFSAGISYLKEEGVFGNDSVNSTFKRLNLRLNSEHILWKTSNRNIVVIGENLSYSNAKNPTIRTGNIYWNDLHNMLIASPFIPLMGDTVTNQARPYPFHYAIPWNSGEPNPMATMTLQSQDNWNNNNTILGNIYLEIQPIKNLLIRSSLGINNWFGSSRQYTPVYDFGVGGTNATDQDQVRQSMYSGYTWTSTNTISYSFKLSDAHNFSLLLGHEAVKTLADLSIGGYNRNTLFGDPEYAYLDNAPTLDPSYTTLSGRDNYGKAILSYFGRLSYDYREKYLLTAVLRRDASSNFAEGHRWGTFPSVSAGWVLSSEPFMENLSNSISYLKVRGSWGQNGNEDIGAFRYLASIGTYSDPNNQDATTEYYFFGTDKAHFDIGAFPPFIANPDIKWETSEQLDMGFDANFLINRLQFTLDYYKKTTRDWLVTAPVLASYGTGAPIINGGTIVNKGVELQLSWNERKTDLTYSVTGSFAYNKNLVTEIQNEEKIIHGQTNVLSQGTGEFYRAEEGYPVGYFWVYETDGILQNEAEVQQYRLNDTSALYFADAAPGDLRFVDQNKDGVIDDQDRIMGGSPQPHVIVGLQFNIDYKGLYMNMVLSGAFGQQVAKSYRSYGDSPRNNFTTDVLDRWTGEGTSDTYPKIYARARDNTALISDFFIEDAGYVRISNLTLGYDLKKGIKALPVAEMRLYVSARNLWTFTKYSGMDPEVGYAPDPWASGIDLGLYPVARTYLVGLNIQF
jgi:TonB-dependent starch-binding outer membrane protein SusC